MLLIKPDKTVARRVVEQIKASDLLKRFRENFTAATGLPLFFQARGDFGPPTEGVSDLRPEFCRIIHHHRRTCHHCLADSAAVHKCAEKQVYTSVCFAGLKESAVPVFLENEPIAYLKTGGVMESAAEAENFITVRRMLADCGWKRAELDSLEEVWLASPHMSGHMYAGMMGLLAMFGDNLSAFAEELALKSVPGEPETIEKARKYIRENLERALTLDEVRQHAGLSESHFCRLFKSVTGLTFVEYVQRSRIHWAKQELMDIQNRIAEVAYKVGFQSISQFNRAFMRIVGQTPSEFRKNRENLSTPAPREVSNIG